MNEKTVQNHNPHPNHNNTNNSNPHTLIKKPPRANVMDELLDLCEKHGIHGLEVALYDRNFTVSITISPVSDEKDDSDHE